MPPTGPPCRSAYERCSTRWVRSGAVLVAVVLGFGVAACDPADPDPTLSPTIEQTSESPSAAPTQTPGPTLTPSPTPTPSPTKMSDREAARQAVLDYYEEDGRIGMDPDGDPNDIKKVAGGEQATIERAKFREWRAKGWTQTQPAQIKNLQITGISTQGSVATAEASFCVDVSEVDVVDRNGTSQVVDGRPDEFNSLMWLEKQSDGRWLAVKERDGGDACDG